MKRKPGVERRKSQRLELALPIKYHLYPRRKTLVEKISSRDISGHGLGLMLTRPLKKGAKLKVQLCFPTDSRPVSALSEVMWCKPSLKKRGFFDIGMRNLKIMPPDKERFVFLFCETMVNFLV